MHKTKVVPVTPQLTYTTEKSTYKTLLKLSVYILYIICVSILADKVAHQYRFFFQNNLVRAVKSGQFNSITTIAGYWEFVDRFLFFLHGIPSNDSDTEAEEVRDAFPSSPVLVGRHFLNSIMLGPPRFRQIRVRRESCMYQRQFIRYFNDCVAPYTPDIELKVPDYKGTKFYTKSELEVSSISGKFATYHGAGYVQDLTYDNDSNFKIVRKLRKDKWLNRPSRLIVLEFTIYSQDIHMFLGAKLCGEILATGLVHPFYDMFIVMEDPLDLYNNYFTLFCTLILVSINSYYMYLEFLAMRQQGLLFYLYNIFTHIKIIGLCIIYVMMGYLIYHYIYMVKLFRRWDEDDRYISMDYVLHAYAYFEDGIGIFICFSYMGLLSYFDFDPVLKIIKAAWHNSRADLLAFLVMFFIIIVAYGSLGYLLFGAQDINFYNFKHSIYSMIRMISADFDYFTLEKKFRIMGPIYFITYIILVYFILMNMFLAIIVLAYRTASQVEIIPPTYLCYVFKKFLHRITKGRVKAPVNPEISPIQLTPGALAKKLKIDREEAELVADMKMLYEKVYMIEDTLLALTVNMDEIIAAAGKVGKKKNKGNLSKSKKP